MDERGRVLVIGGTQGAGEEIVRRLLADGRPVRILARSPGKARRKFGDAVEVHRGDVTDPGTLPPAMSGVRHLISTVGVPGRVARRRTARATVRDGTLNTLRAASVAGLPGRFLYMSALGTTRASVLSFLLNGIKGGTLKYRREVEAEMRRNGLTHTIIHAGILTNDPPGQRPVEIAQEEHALRPRYRISRADVAEVVVRSLAAKNAANATFDVVWARDDDPGSIEEQLARLVPDG